MTSRRQHNGRLSPMPQEGVRKARLRRMVSVQQAVAALAERGLVVDESTVRRALASGRLKGDKPGRDWLVDARSLEAFSLRRTVNRKEAASEA